MAPNLPRLTAQTAHKKQAGGFTLPAAAVERNVSCAYNELWWRLGGSAAKQSSSKHTRHAVVSGRATLLFYSIQYCVGVSAKHKEGEIELIYAGKLHWRRQ